jgi:hypothetical protein
MNHLNEIHTLPENTEDPYTLRNDFNNINLLTDNTDEDRNYKKSYKKKFDVIFFYYSMILLLKMTHIIKSLN